jgi:hypothetical protein
MQRTAKYQLAARQRAPYACFASRADPRVERGPVRAASVTGWPLGGRLSFGVNGYAKKHHKVLPVGGEIPKNQKGLRACEGPSQRQPAPFVAAASRYSFWLRGGKVGTRAIESHKFTLLYGIFLRFPGSKAIF